MWWVMNFLFREKMVLKLKDGPQRHLRHLISPLPYFSFHEVICYIAQVTSGEVYHIYWIVRPQKQSTLCLTRGAGTQILMSLRRGWGGGLVYRQALSFVGRYKILMVQCGQCKHGFFISSYSSSQWVLSLFYSTHKSKRIIRLCSLTSHRIEARM